MLWILCGSLVLVVVSVSSLNVAIPEIQRSLDASGSELQWIIDSYALVFAGLLLPAGAIGDRYGRKHALLGGLAIFAIASPRSTAAVDRWGERVVMSAGMAIAALGFATLALLRPGSPYPLMFAALALVADSLGGLFEAAATLPAPDVAPLVEAGASTFADGMQLGMLAATGLLAATAALVAALHPRSIRSNTQTQGTAR